uniref:Phospholipase A2 n=1 Tax=Kalanchoe fedtschenkoi TaxID=63787 RepID=A0A7N0VFF5_KALFE
MHFEFLNNLPLFQIYANKDRGNRNRTGNILMEGQARQSDFLGIKSWGCSLLSLVPWAFKTNEKTRTPPTINRELKRRAQQPRNTDSRLQATRLRFRPYVSKVPWHTGARAFLSQFFPRYGHYCGPNWSSGKDGGSLLWDKRPIDWLDFCCYCHDMGYDSHDQAELLKADLAFLDCLERPNMSTRGDAHVAFVYKTMCITGLRNILIPYRKQLIGMQSGQPLIGFGWLGNMNWRCWNMPKDTKA